MFLIKGGYYASKDYQQRITHTCTCTIVQTPIPTQRILKVSLKRKSHETRTVGQLMLFLKVGYHPQLFFRFTFGFSPIVPHFFESGKSIPNTIMCGTVQFGYIDETASFNES